MTVNRKFNTIYLYNSFNHAVLALRAPGRPAAATPPADAEVSWTPERDAFSVGSSAPSVVHRVTLHLSCARGNRVLGRGPATPSRRQQDPGSRPQRYQSTDEGDIGKQCKQPSSGASCRSRRSSFVFTRSAAPAARAPPDTNASRRRIRSASRSNRSNPIPEARSPTRVEGMLPHHAPRLAG